MHIAAMKPESMDIVDLDKNPIGYIVGFHNFGAGDIVEVKPEGSETIFLPFTGFLKQVRIIEKQLVMNIPDGFINQEFKITSFKNTQTIAWQATVLTLYPEMFPGQLSEVLFGKALENKLWLSIIHI